MAGAAPAEVLNGQKPDPVVRLENVTHRYGKVLAADSLSLTIAAQRVTGIIGPDGVGKSTLLSLIAGARVIQDGTVTVLGGDMADADHRRAVCPRIAYMPQGLGKNLYPDLSVRENIEFFGRLFGQSQEELAARLADLLDSTGLAPFADRPAKKLSGGMRQKLGLCCSLIHDPDLLILDEPTTGVDPLSRRQFWQLIGRIRVRRPSMSVIVATAYMEEAEQFDTLIAMDAGRVLASGSPAEIKAAARVTSLEDAFIAMLPVERRRDHHAVVVPPRPPDGAEPVIVTHDLTRRFGEFTAVDAVNFTIERGEIFGFVGSNGCGKTTTMKMLTGLLPASAGEALLFGQPVTGGRMRDRRRVGYMSQSFSLYAELTVRQNLDLHARLFHLSAEKVRTRIPELIERFGLGDYLQKRASDLPLGIRQRLSLCVAVVHEPEMLILDEPTSGVDPIARDAFWRLLIELSRKEGVTIFVSTHFMNEAARCEPDRTHGFRQGAGARQPGCPGTRPQGGKPGGCLRRLPSGRDRDRGGQVGRAGSGNRKSSRKAPRIRGAHLRPAAVRLCHPGGAGTRPRSGPARLRLLRHRPADGDFRGRHHHRRQRSLLCRPRPRPHAGEPCLPLGTQRLALFQGKNPRSRIMKASSAG